MPILTPENILKTTNESTPLFSNLFGSANSSFYEFFYNSFLTTPNSLPLNNLWIVFFNSIPESILQKVSDYEGWGNDLKPSHDSAKQEGLRTKSGLLIAQGVKILGEKIDVQRIGPGKMGAIRGIVGEGRSPYQTFTISMMENQLSFVDYVLRPWVIAAANASLKDPEFKTDIVVWHLGKMGARRDMARRKIFIYKNCVPVSIDEQEYNYSGNDVLIKRSVDFAFSKYILERPDDKFIKLIENGYKEKGFLTDIIGGLKDDLTRALGANNLNEFVANTVDGLRTFAVNTIETGIGNVSGNTIGAVSDTVNGAVSNLGAEIRGDVNRGISGVNDSVNEAINELTKSGNETAPPSFTNLNDDVPKFSNPNTLQTSGSNPNVNLKSIPSDDTPDYKTLPAPIIMGKNPVIDTNKPINQLDTPLNVLESPNRKLGDPNSDTVRFSDLIPFKRVSNPVDDSRVQFENVPFVRKNVNRDDFIKNTDIIDYKNITTNQDDFRRGNGGITFDNKIAVENDVPENSKIQYKIKTTNPDDVTNYKKPDKVVVI